MVYSIDKIDPITCFNVRTKIVRIGKFSLARLSEQFNNTIKITYNFNHNKVDY